MNLWDVARAACTLWSRGSWLGGALVSALCICCFLAHRLPYGPFVFCCFALDFCAIPIPEVIQCYYQIKSDWKRFGVCCRACTCEDNKRHSKLPWKWQKPSSSSPHQIPQLSKTSFQQTLFCTKTSSTVVDTRQKLRAECKLPENVENHTSCLIRRWDLSKTNLFNIGCPFPREFTDEFTIISTHPVRWLGRGLDPSHHLRRYPSRGAWRVPSGGGHEGEKGLKPPWSPLEAPLKPFSSPLEALLKPPWSPLEALLKPPSSPFEAPFTLKPPSSPSQAPLKPFSSPLEAPFKQATFKPFSSPLEAPLKPFSSPLEATLNGSQAPQASFKPFWSPRPAPWKPVQALPKGLFYVRTSVRQLRCPNSCATTAV